MTYKQVRVELIIIMTRSKDKTQKKKKKSNKWTLKNERKGENIKKTIEGVSILTWTTISVLAYVWFFMFENDNLNWSWNCWIYLNNNIHNIS
jgi:hypothetical protein